VRGPPGRTSCPRDRSALGGSMARGERITAISCRSVGGRGRRGFLDETPPPVLLPSLRDWTTPPRTAPPRPLQATIPGFVPRLTLCSLRLSVSRVSLRRSDPQRRRSSGGSDADGQRVAARVRFRRLQVDDVSIPSAVAAPPKTRARRQPGRRSRTVPVQLSHQRRTDRSRRRRQKGHAA